MKTRIITGLLAFLLLVAILFSPVVFFEIALILVSFSALYEVMKATGLLKNKPLVFVNFLFSALLMYAFRISLIISVMMLITYLFTLFTLMVFCHKNIVITDVVTSYFLMLYTVCLLHFIVLIRTSDFGLLNVFILLIGVFATDTFAYFTGVSIGKHKLCPEISPKKTIEGSLGGWIGCILLLFIYGYFLSKFSYKINFTALAVFSVICGGLSQIGDLTASIIKRFYGIKDYGNLLPGHGGIMDRLDSILLVSPLLYLFILYFPVIG